MAERKGPGYGTPNWEMISRWLELEPGRDGPFWAVNLMKYRPVAEYADRAGPVVSGREADDRYAPLGPLEAVGAMVAFHGDVVDQRAGQPVWDRVGIVRYPSRAAFFAMQQRDDFKKQHVHKEAGMETTIVMACQPVGDAAPPRSGQLVMVVDRGAHADGGADGGGGGDADGGLVSAAFAVEGVIVGDERRWDRVRFVHAADPTAVDRLAAASAEVEEAFVMVVEPTIDRLQASIGYQTSAREAAPAIVDHVLRSDPR